MHSRYAFATTAIAATAALLCITLPARAQSDYPGDVDQNGFVDLADLQLLLAAYGTTPGDSDWNAGADFNYSGTVNLADLQLLLANYGTSIPPANMVDVPAGAFEMGDSFNEGAADEHPVHSVHLDSYYIDKFEITNAEYAAALNWARAAGRHITVMSGIVYKYNSGTSFPYCNTASCDETSGIQWNGNTFYATSGKEDLPVVQVSWYGAAAFCNWRSAIEERPLCYNLATWTCAVAVAGYRLPTEAEWEKAAGWDVPRQRHNRFAEQTDGCAMSCLDSQRANYANSGDPYESGVYPFTTPVGFYDGTTHNGFQTQDARSPFGCFDMSGNVWEWCNDWYDTGYYDASPSENPLGPASGIYRVLRGGNWYSNAYYCRSAVRFRYLPDNRYHGYGFRCVMSAP